MKLLKYSLLLGFLSCIACPSYAYLYDIDKVIEKSFPIKSDGTFDLSNKYGNIDITEWDKNEISIKVTITVKTSNQSKADEIFDRIDVEFNNSSSNVSAETQIETKKSWFGITSWSGGGIKYQVNYEVKMPQSVHLICKNKYGNTYVPDLNNGAEMEIKYGNLKLGSVEGESIMDVGYSNIDFGDLGDLRLEAKYSNIKGSSAQKVVMDTKYSIFELGDVKSIDCDTKSDAFTIDRVEKINNDGSYDSWKIDEVASFESDTKYSSIVIDNVSERLVIEQDYGIIKVDQINCEKADVDLELKFTDLNLDTGNCENMEVDYEGEHISLNLMSSLEDKISRDGSDTWLKSDAGSRALKMKVRMKYGKFKLR